MQSATAWHRYGTLILLIFSFGLALISVSVVLTLKNSDWQSSGPHVPELIQTPPAITVPESAPAIEHQPAGSLATARVEPDSAQLEDRLIRLRRDYGYRLNGATLNDESAESGAPLSIGQIEAGHPLVLQTLQQWFFDDPEAFIEMAASEERDSYIQAVLRTQINASNVHLLTDQMHIRNRHLIELAYTHKLHLQNPAPFLEIFDQFVGSHLISVPASVVAAAAESDYWGRREVLIGQAVGNPEPGMYFDVLARHGHENMSLLAEQMWETHLADNYTEALTSGTGYLERTRLAYQYGVAGAPAMLARLQAKGLFVDETIRMFTATDDADVRFQDIHSQLQYSYEQQRWQLLQDPAR